MKAVKALAIVCALTASGLMLRENLVAATFSTAAAALMLADLVKDYRKER